MSRDDEAGSSSSTVIIIVSIVGVVVVLVVLVCGGVIFLLARTVSQAVATAVQQEIEKQGSLMLAQEFLDDLSNDRVDAAYANTSKAYQGRLTREQFGDLVKKHPGLKDSSGVPTPSSVLTPTSASFTATLTGPNGPVTVTLRAIKEDGQWKVDQFTPTGAGAPAKEPAKDKAKEPAKET
jgi:hypothetical protein